MKSLLTLSTCYVRRMRVPTILLCAAGAVSLSAQPTSSPTVTSESSFATVSGRVRNAATGAYLEGAEVALEGVPWRTFTQSEPNTSGFTYYPNDLRR